MIAGPDTLYMFYKSGSASKLYCYDGNNTDYIGLTATSLGLTDIITIGNTLYYSANKALYKVSGKTISAIPTPFGATTTMNWVRAVGHKVAYIATDATYGKEARIYNPADNSVKVADAAPKTWTSPPNFSRPSFASCTELAHVPPRVFFTNGKTE